MKYTIVGRVVTDTFRSSDEQRTVGYVLSNEQGVCRAFTLSLTHEFYKKGELTAPINSFTDSGIDFKGIDNSLLPKYSEQYVSFTTVPYVIDTRRGVMAEVSYDTRQGFGFIKSSPDKFFRYKTANIIVNIKIGQCCLVNATVNKGVIEQSTAKVIVSHNDKSYTVIEAGGNCKVLSAEAIIKSMQNGVIYFNAYLQNGTIVLKHEVPYIATPAKEQITFINEFKTKDVEGYIEKYTSKFKGKDDVEAPAIDTMFQRYRIMNSRYKGNVLNGKPHGKGIKLYVNGDYYEGEWKHGEFDGKGKLVCPATRMVYEGQFKNGVPHGNGDFFYARSFSMTIFGMTSISEEFDCLRYEGEFANGKRHGKGTMYFIHNTPINEHYDEDDTEDYDEDYDEDDTEDYDEGNESPISFEGKWANDEMVHGKFSIASLNNMIGNWENGHMYGHVLCYEELDGNSWSSSTYNYETEQGLGCNFRGYIDDDFEINRGIFIDNSECDIAIPFLKVYDVENEDCRVAIYSIQRITEDMYQGNIFYTNNENIDSESSYFRDENLDNDTVYYRYYAVDFSKVLPDSYAIYRGNLNADFKPHGKGVLMFRQGYYIGEFEDGKISGKGTVYLNNQTFADRYNLGYYLWSPYTVTDNDEIKFNGLKTFEKLGLSTIAKIEGIWETHGGNDKVWGYSPILKEGKLTLLSDGSEYEEGVLLKIDPEFSDGANEANLMPANEGILFLRGKKGMTYTSDTSDGQLLLRCLIEMVSKSFGTYHKGKYTTKEDIDGFIHHYLDKWGTN